MPKSRKRNKKPSSGGGAGGGMMALRGGFKNFMGAGRGKGKPPTLTSRILDTALWVAVIGLVVVLFYNRFSQ